ncbi:MAG: hypothetical protein GX052_04095 [Syntrophomonadaceae bacterium]|nr:hypothetical protein [Syntrophomonadaceae bacterium]
MRKQGAAVDRLAERLLDNLERQEELYTSMRHLAREQLKTVRSPASSGLDRDLILKQRAELLQHLEPLGKRGRIIERDLARAVGLEQFTVKGIEGKVDNELHRRLRQAFERLGVLLGEITEIDAESVRLMSSQLAGCHQTPRRPVSSAEALQAYRESSRVKKDRG